MCITVKYWIGKQLQSINKSDKESFVLPLPQMGEAAIKGHEPVFVPFDCRKQTTAVKGCSDEKSIPYHKKYFCLAGGCSGRMYDDFHRCIGQHLWPHRPQHLRL